MSTSIIPQLVIKDLLITRKIILIFCAINILFIAIVGVLFGRVPNWAFVNLAFVLLVAPLFTCGMVLVFRTIVMEKVKATQPFIMSLPVTVKEFTAAKLWVNLPIFCALWVLSCGVTFYFAFWLGVFPYGTLPFVTMIFLGALLAYICILSASLIFQSHGITIISILLFELATSAYLWILVYLKPIANHIYGPVSVWNSTAITVIASQIFAAIFVILMTIYIQNKKRDFI
ncbi:hypothetical protein [Cellvibrio zantedeschiae]|uniref:hypothetical protein n=1 Tax=Cellvibrio zantedeschiae TaxID=1237077 RepID=UPI0016754A0B|nr:hypothetical protein [Cellvibrio zantedeschiae]